MIHVGFIFIRIQMYCKNVRYKRDVFNFKRTFKKRLRGKIVACFIWRSYCIKMKNWFRTSCSCWNCQISCNLLPTSYTMIQWSYTQYHSCVSTELQQVRNSMFSHSAGSWNINRSSYTFSNSDVYFYTLKKIYTISLVFIHLMCVRGCSKLTLKYLNSILRTEGGNNLDSPYPV